MNSVPAIYRNTVLYNNFLVRNIDYTRHLDSIKLALTGMEHVCGFFLNPRQQLNFEIETGR